MGVKMIHRPARTTPPARTVEPYALDAPPPVNEGRSGMNMMSLVPLLGAGASMTVMMLFRGSSLAAVGALMMIVTILASIAMMVSQKGKQARQSRDQREHYLEYLERARTEWLRALGKSQERLRREHDLVFAVRAMRMDFRAPARLDDRLEATAALRACRRASLVFAQSIRREGALLVDAEVRVASLGATDFRPRPLPTDLYDEFASLETPPA